MKSEGILCILWAFLVKQLFHYRFDTFNKLLKNCYFKIAYNLVTWTYFNIFIFMF